MADRHGAPSRNGTRGINHPRPAPGGVRRNLFQAGLTRRPTPGSSTSAETLRLDVDVQSESSDIVVRNKNGEIELEDPPTPPIDDPDEIALDARQENEKERQKLADAVKHHQINQHSLPAQPEELFEAVRASLRAKVAALAEDNWMFEKEDELRYQ